MTDWDKVKIDYDSGLTDQELADKYGIKKNTVKVHRNRNKWGPANRSNKKRNVTKTSNRNVTRKETVTDTDTVMEDAVEKISKSDLRDRQKLFCQYYLKSYNATQSYKKAYKCSYETAMVEGSNSLRNPKVKSLLNQIRKEQAGNLLMDASDVLKEYAKRAFANVGDYVHVKKISQQRLDENGNPVSDIDGNPIIDTYNQIYTDDSSEMDMSLVSEIHKGKDGLVVKLKDDKDALKALLERLPEPVDDTPQQNTFLNALEMSQKVFSENEQTNENEQNSTDENNNADK